MTLISHHPAAHQRQLLDRSANGAQHHITARTRTKRVGRPGACSLEFVDADHWPERESEMATRETQPHDIDAKKLAALMLAMASRGMSGAARTYVAACIEGSGLRGFGDGNKFGRDASDSVKSSDRSSVHQRSGWHAMVRSLVSDPTVITYFVRPARVVVSIVADDGAAVPAAIFAPDLVVVRNDEVVAIDVRNEQVEVIPSKERVENFIFAPTGTRGYPTNYQLFKSMGIRYERVTVGHPGSDE